MVLPWAGQGMSIGWGSGLSTPIQAFAELGRTTLGTSGSTIQVSSLPNKKWLMVLASVGVNATNCDVRLRLGNGSLDTGSNYADRNSVNGSADTTSTTQAQINDLYNSAADNFPRFFVFFIENTSANEKLIQCWSVEQKTAGAGNVPNRIELVGKWTNTSNVIDTLAIVNLNTGSFGTGSEVVVLGADPSDTNVTPFFKELGRNTLGSSNSAVTVSGITSKKYNMFTFYGARNAAATDNCIRLGNGSVDSGTNYADRYSTNGAADTTHTSASQIFETVSSSTPKFMQGFFINVASSEKLLIAHDIEQNTAGAANAPVRREIVGKWANTSNQANNLSLNTGSADTFNSGSELVWYGEN